MDFCFGTLVRRNRGLSHSVVLQEFQRFDEAGEEFTQALSQLRDALQHFFSTKSSHHHHHHRQGRSESD